MTTAEQLERVFASGGALETCVARFGGRSVTATASVCAPRGTAPVGTTWYASDEQLRRATVERIELGPRIVEGGWDR